MNSLGLEIRCTCSKSPLLAIGGRGTDGKPYVHVKAYKQNKVITELVATEGTVRIRCRACDRWLTLTIRPTTLTKLEEPLPASICVK